MSDLDIRIVTIEPIRVASVWGFGPSPEEIAWQKLQAWAGSKGLLDRPEKHRIFGFNNPNPSAGSPNYGYELWIEVDSETGPDADVRIEGFQGGAYAVSRCEVPAGDYSIIHRTWKQLAIWRESSRFKGASHQWLEEFIPVELPGIELVLDLHIPIAE